MIRSGRPNSKLMMPKLEPKISCSKFNFKQRLFSVSFVTFTVKALLLNFLCKVYSTNMTSFREREEKREKETLTATNFKAAAGSALSKCRCSKNGHCLKADCRNALALVVKRTIVMEISYTKDGFLLFSLKET